MNIPRADFKGRNNPAYRHGMAGTPIYKLWAGILTRCYNAKVKIYKYYGGRGIKVCERWHDFSNFYADMGDRPRGLQIDRINNEGDYTPDNCRWITPKENNPYNKGDVKDDMPGKRFGKWLVIERVNHKPGHRYYFCRCNCGSELIMGGGELRRKDGSRQCMKCKHESHKGWRLRKHANGI